MSSTKKERCKQRENVPVQTHHFSTELSASFRISFAVDGDLQIFQFTFEIRSSHADHFLSLVDRSPDTGIETGCDNSCSKSPFSEDEIAITVC